jgi:hypothetical protein
MWYGFILLNLSEMKEMKSYLFFIIFYEAVIGGHTSFNLQITEYKYYI